jgi:hypothetical protein
MIVGLRRVRRDLVEEEVLDLEVGAGIFFAAAAATVGVRRG